MIKQINFIKADLDTVCTAALLTSYPKTYQENTRYQNLIRNLSRATEKENRLFLKRSF